MKLLLFLAFVLTFAPVHIADAQVRFEDLTFEAALVKAKAEGRDVFVYLWTEWCAPCRQLESIAFADPAVSAAINEYIPLKLNAEEGQGIDVNSRYKVSGYPAFLFLNASGKELGRVIGTRSNPTYVTAIRSRGAEDPR